MNAKRTLACRASRVAICDKCGEARAPDRGRRQVDLFDHVIDPSDNFVIDVGATQCARERQSASEDVIERTTRAVPCRPVFAGHAGPGGADRTPATTSPTGSAGSTAPSTARSASSRRRPATSTVHSCTSPEPPNNATRSRRNLAATRPHIERYRLFASGLNAVILAEFAVAPIGSLVTWCAPDARCACCLSMRRWEATRRCKKRRGDVRASRRCRPHQRSAWPSMTRSFLATPTGLSSA